LREHRSAWRCEISENKSNEISERNNAGRREDKTHIGSGFEEPFTSGFSVGDGFLGGESLGSDDEESSFGVASLGDFGNVSSVDVRNEVHLESLLTVRLESLGDHDGSEI